MEYNNPNAGKGLGIGGLVVGIIGLLISCVPVVALVMGVVALGLSIGGLVAANKNYAKKTLQTIALVISIFVCLIGLAWNVFILKEIPNLLDDFNNNNFNYDIQDDFYELDNNFDSLQMDTSDIENLNKSSNDLDNGPGSSPPE